MHWVWCGGLLPNETAGRVGPIRILAGSFFAWRIVDAVPAQLPTSIITTLTTLAVGNARFRYAHTACVRVLFADLAVGTCAAIAPVALAQSVPQWTTLGFCQDTHLFALLGKVEADMQVWLPVRRKTIDTVGTSPAATTASIVTARRSQGIESAVRCAPHFFPSCYFLFSASEVHDLPDLGGRIRILYPRNINANIGGRPIDRARGGRGWRTASRQCAAKCNKQRFVQPIKHIRPILRM